ncbi:hypothetical protein V8F33_008081 [Rhypophila sp. PSN 637]
MGSDGDGDKPVPSFIDSPELGRIQNDVRVALMEKPPSGSGLDQKSSLQDVKHYLARLSASVCGDLYDQQRPLPDYISKDAIDLLTLIKGYRISGNEVPQAWMDVCQKALQPLDQKMPVAIPSQEYRSLYNNRQPDPVPSKDIVEKFARGEIWRNHGTSSSSTTGTSRKRMRLRPRYYSDSEYNES